MVEDLVEGDVVFHALASTARRAIIARLSDGALTVGELAEPMSMSLAGASKHIKVLEQAGLIQRRVQGRRHVCVLDARPLESVSHWLQFYERHWHERLDALEQMLNDNPPSRSGSQ